MPTSTDAPTSPNAPGQPASVLVLYIEDNAINVLLMEQALELHAPRYRLATAVDGEQGLAALKQARPDVVLLDINLPGIDGHEVLRRLRADAATATLPCVAVSADAMPEEVSRALAAGFDDYWTKPLDITRLAERLERVLAGRKT